MISPLITVAICTRNRAALLEKAVRSVLAQMTGRAEILIVDNGSTDDTAQLATKFSFADPRVIIFHEPQTGLSHARNLVLRAARGEWIVFLDDDAEVETGWLAAYENFFSNPPHAGVTCAGGPISPNFETSPPAWFVSNSDGFNRVDKTRRCEPGEHPWGCNYAVRREAALAVGGFNPALGHRGLSLGAHEETELTGRLQQAGGEVWLVVDARIRHFVSAERLRLKWQLRSSFGVGRSRAINLLMRRKTRGERTLFILGRILIAPFHCAMHLLVALVTVPFQNGRVAAMALRRAGSMAGFTFELLPQIYGKNSEIRPQSDFSKFQGNHCGRRLSG
jgi:glycosyltransferase involved in cell wall biosynthesis